MNKQPLRFAPLIRVSTEKQEAQGESLRTQKKQILQYVKYLKGVIPEHCWKYSGQEHAAPEWERRKLDQLLTDSSKDLFDAVIICDVSRWSRDDEKSIQSLKIFQQNQIRLFIGTDEYDYYNPEQDLSFSVLVKVAQFQARQQALKSITNRIEKAKRGIPVTGKWPAGREFKNGEWRIKKGFQAKIRRAAEMIISGTPLKQTAEVLGINRSGMRHTLLERCGTTWYQNFRADRFNINESIPTKVPELLPDDMIQAVKLRLQRNKTIFHGQMKNKYLLGRMILCGHCGKPLFGLTSRGKQYYRHADCKHLTSIPAAFVEDAVMVHLFSFFGNQAAMEKAIQAAIPDYTEIDQFVVEKNEMEQEIKQIKVDRNKLLDLALKGVIEDSDLQDKMTKLRERESLLKDQLVGIKQKLGNIPSAETVGQKADLLRYHIESIYSSGLEFAEMTFDERRKLLQLAFTGQNPDGTRPGVYIKKDGKDDWSFEIKGVIPGETISDYLPMERWKANEMLGIEDDNYDPFSLSKQKTVSSDH